MNKFLNLSLLFLAFELSSNTSLEITTIEIQNSYNTIQRFPGKILPLNYSKLAFEVPGKISEVKIDIGDAVKRNDILAALDPAEMQANLNQAQARFDLADQALNRFKDLDKYLATFPTLLRSCVSSWSGIAVKTKVSSATLALDPKG